MPPIYVNINISDLGYRDIDGVHFVAYLLSYPMQSFIICVNS